MDDHTQHQAFMTALVTEHFVLQSARSSTTSEATGRASLYLTTVSGALIALGFISQVGHGFDSFAAAILPAIFVLGELTYVRTLTVAVEDIGMIRDMHSIRRYYRTLVPQGSTFFAEDAGDTPYPAGLTAVLATERPTAFKVVYTTASLVAAVNSIIGGVGTTLALSRFTPLAAPMAAGAGVLIACGLFLAHLIHQTRRFHLVFDYPSAKRTA